MSASTTADTRTGTALPRSHRCQCPAQSPLATLWRADGACLPPAGMENSKTSPRVVCTRAAKRSVLWATGCHRSSNMPQAGNIPGRLRRELSQVGSSSHQRDLCKPSPISRPAEAVGGRGLSGKAKKGIAHTRKYHAHKTEYPRLHPAPPCCFSMVSV